MASARWRMFTDTGTTTGSATCNGWYAYDNGGTTTYPVERIYVVGDQILSGGTLTLPDGAKLVVDDAGNYYIEDKDAKVTYRANRFREFSPYLNASDMLARFVQYVGSVGVKQSEVLGLPIELFINWLVIEAAERDQDPVPENIRPIIEHKAVRRLRKPRCLKCNRFIPLLHAQHRFDFCNPNHATSYLQRAGQKRIGRVESASP